MPPKNAAAAANKKKLAAEKEKNKKLTKLLADLQAGRLPPSPTDLKNDSPDLGEKSDHRNIEARVLELHYDPETKTGGYSLKSMYMNKLLADQVGVQKVGHIWDKDSSKTYYFAPEPTLEPYVKALKDKRVQEVPFTENHKGYGEPADKPCPFSYLQRNQATHDKLVGLVTPDTSPDREYIYDQDEPAKNKDQGAEEAIKKYGGVAGISTTGGLHERAPPLVLLLVGSHGPEGWGKCLQGYNRTAASVLPEGVKDNNRAYCPVSRILRLRPGFTMALSSFAGLLFVLNTGDLRMCEVVKFGAMSDDVCGREDVSSDPESGRFFELIEKVRHLFGRYYPAGQDYRRDPTFRRWVGQMKEMLLSLLMAHQSGETVKDEMQSFLVARLSNQTAAADKVMASLLRDSLQRARGERKSVEVEGQKQLPAALWVDIKTWYSADFIHCPAKKEEVAGIRGQYLTDLLGDNGRILERWVNRTKAPGAAGRFGDELTGDDEEGLGSFGEEEDPHHGRKGGRDGDREVPNKRSWPSKSWWSAQGVAAGDLVRRNNSRGWSVAPGVWGAMDGTAKDRLTKARLDEMSKE
jgi:hypothetical protein